MKTCNQCHIKKSDVEFAKGKVVCKSCRDAKIKPERIQAKFAENEEQCAEFYREAAENGSNCAGLSRLSANSVIVSLLYPIIPMAKKRIVNAF